MALQNRNGTRAAFKGTYYLRKNEKDPVIDAIHTLIDESHSNYNAAAAKAGISRTTVANWIDGDTRCPQHAKLAAIAKACGYKFQLVPDNHRANGHTIKAMAPRIIRSETAPSKPRRPFREESVSA